MVIFWAKSSYHFSSWLQFLGFRCGWMQELLLYVFLLLLFSFLWCFSLLSESNLYYQLLPTQKPLTYGLQCVFHWCLPVYFSSFWLTNWLEEKEESEFPMPMFLKTEIVIQAKWKWVCFAHIKFIFNYV